VFSLSKMGRGGWVVRGGGGYKHYANAQQYYVIHTLPIVLICVGDKTHLISSEINKSKLGQSIILW